MGRSATGLKKIQRSWNDLESILKLISTEKEYEQAVDILDRLVDEVGENESHPLSGLLQVLSLLIENYEDQHLRLRKGDAVKVLKFLMHEHRLVQKDLHEIGSQGVVSEILSGKRELNVRQIEALSKRFNVSPAVFVR